MRFLFLLLAVNVSLTGLTFAKDTNQSFSKIHENRKKLYQIRMDENNRVLFYLNQTMDEVVKQNSTHQTEFGFIHTPVRYEHSSSYLSVPISQYVLTASILLLLTLLLVFFIRFRFYKMAILFSIFFAVTVTAYTLTLFGQNIFSDNIAGAMGLYHFYKMRDELHYTLSLQEKDKMESGSCLVFFRYRKKDDHLNLSFEIDNCTHKDIFPENQVSKFQRGKKYSLLSKILGRDKIVASGDMPFYKPFSTISDMKTSLIKQILDGDKRAVQETLANKGSLINFNTTSIDGLTILHIAVIYGHKDIIELLLGAGADVNVQSNLSPLLHFAIMKYRPAITNLFISSGADINAISSQGKAPLHLAVESHQKEVVQSLLDAGADADIKNTLGHAPLHIATRFGMLEIMEILLRAGANINITDNTLDTPLHYAFLAQQIKSAYFLIDSDADLEAKNTEGKSPYDLILSKKNLKEALCVKVEGKKCLLKKDQHLLGKSHNSNTK